MDHCFTQLKEAVRIEKAFIRQSFEEQLRLSPQEQRSAGLLLFPLSITEQSAADSRSDISFRVSFAINDTYFRKGCRVQCITADGYKAEGRLTDLYDHGGVFAVSDDDLPNLRNETVSLQFIPDDRTIACMELGCRLAETHPQLLSIRTGETPAAPALLSNTLNSEQQLAAGAVAGNSPFVLIQGPPGTGKTYTLAEAVATLVKQGKQVILCAPSNTATDHLCRAVSKQGIPILRLGNDEKISDDILPFTLEAHLEKVPDARCSIICGNHYGKLMPRRKNTSAIIPVKRLRRNRKLVKSVPLCARKSGARLPMSSNA